MEPSADTAQSRNEAGGEVRGKPQKPTLRQMRLRHGLSVNELAAQAGVAPSTVLFIERGEASPRMATIRHLCTVLECAYDAIAWPRSPFEE